jgi:glycosyltransferase involved in cell wall biosynthesis
MRVLLFFPPIDVEGGYPADFRILVDSMQTSHNDVVASGSLAALVRICFSKNPPLVHLVGFFQVKSYFAAMLLTVCRKPWVYSTLGQETPFLVRRRHRVAKIFAIETFDRWFAPSAKGRHVFSSWELRQATVAKNSFRRGLPIHDEMGFPESGASLPAVTFQFAGRKDVDQKGLDLLLAAFAQQSSGKLRISGQAQPGVDSILTAEAEALGILDRVEIAGPIEALSRDARWFVYPSRFDGPPRPVRAAIRAGIPVIVTEEGGMADEVCEFGAGITCGATIFSLANALHRAATCTPAEYEAFQRGAANLADHLQPGVVAADYRRWYVSIAANS